MRQREINRQRLNMDYFFTSVEDVSVFYSKCKTSRKIMYDWHAVTCLLLINMLNIEIENATN